MRITACALLVALLFAVALTPACEVSTGSGGTTSYSNDEYGFSLEIADRFKESDDTELAQTSGSGADFSVGFADPDGAKADDRGVDVFLVSVYRLNQQVTPDLMPQLRSELEAALDQVKLQDPAASFGPLSDATINGVPGWTMEYTMKVGGVPVKARSYFLVDGDKEYQLTLQSAEQNWAENEPDLQKAADSFEVK